MQEQACELYVVGPRCFEGGGEGRGGDSAQDDFAGGYGCCGGCDGGACPCAFLDGGGGDAEAEGFGEEGGDEEGEEGAEEVGPGYWEVLGGVEGGRECAEGDLDGGW